MLYSNSVTKLKNPIRFAIPKRGGKRLALPLLVPRIRRADHVDASLTADNLAVFANPFDAGTHFHDWTDREKSETRKARYAGCSWSICRPICS